MRNKNTKVKNYSQANKEKFQEKSQGYYRNLFEVEEIEKRNYADIRNKNMSEEFRRNYYYKKIFF